MVEPCWAVVVAEHKIIAPAKLADARDCILFRVHVLAHGTKRTFLFVIHDIPAHVKFVTHKFLIRPTAQTTLT